MNKQIESLHFITHASPDETISAQVERMCRSGVKWVQLREKHISDDEFMIAAIACKAICNRHDAKFIINDRVRIAAEVGADGVHIGKSDMPPKEVRGIMGPDAIIGSTANTIKDILYAMEICDYIGLGPFEHTTTKDNISSILGVHGMQEIIKKANQNSCTIPIIGIGSVNLSNIEQLKKTGVQGVAISSALILSKSTSLMVNAIHSLWSE